ncbi:MAG: HAMP domain-containing histidine kinase [Candidatus Eisenbacteria bacterium]|uniref:histidine kinase n=1 Tax=Eiseniibacteriota bacterium TaxID=2212470 RepID=A0A9D6L7P8_UNCEI|nr:HAMP domain-containing histidine kinase [Candidatus Eisenbacteria bacterium]MBI3539130.1 HAMP domain-containing histidine kinase [Candidatus Eisenbacteria bacterium]
MGIPPFSRRVLGILGLGVVLPATLLAGLGIYLTLRVSDVVRSQSARYDRYMAQQITEGFEVELLSDLRHALAPAENAAREGRGRDAILAALASDAGDFGEARFIPLDKLDNYDLLLVEHQPIVFAPGPRPGEWFTGLLIHDPDGQVSGVGGWMLDPATFLQARLRPLFEEHLPQNERMYGGIESTRGLVVRLTGPDGRRIVLGGEAGYEPTAYTGRLTGPLAGFSVRVAATQNAPVVWAQRFVILLIVFIVLMGAVLAGATFFGLRYTVRQLELAQQKASFVSNVSHELKTPISLIHLAVETLLMRRFSSQQDAERFLNTINHEAMRLNRIVDHILEFARLEAGKQTFRFEAVDLLPVVRDAVESFRLRLESEGFRLDVEMPADLPLVRADAAALSQCVLNLLDNALKYSRTRREVRVTCAARTDEAGEPRAVVISVQDRGIGIPPRDQKRIFEKFVRIETGLVHDVKGTGLGLSLVDQIMRAHGGHIEVDSAVGEGSTFTLVLPAIRSVAAGARSEPQENAAAS